MLLTDKNGNIVHAEMAYKGAQIGVMREWSNAELLGPATIRSPKSVGALTQFIWVRVDDARAHCDIARKAGARIVQEPNDEPYGDRTYRALDCEGHVWNFRQPIREVPDEVFEQQTGLKYKKSLSDI